MEDHLVYRWVTVQELECTMQEKTPMYDAGDIGVLNVFLGCKIIFYTWSLVNREGSKSPTVDRQHMVIYVAGVANAKFRRRDTSISSMGLQKGQTRLFSSKVTWV